MNPMLSVRDRVKTGKPIPFAMIREAVEQGATKAELMRVTGLSRYLLNQCLRRPLPRSTKPLRRSTKPIPSRRKDPARRAFAKHRDPAYQAWIKTLPCLICGRRPVDPAHVIKRSRGSDDRGNIVPLCRFPHHAEQEGRTAEFEWTHRVALRDETLASVAARLAQQYTEEM